MWAIVTGGDRVIQNDLIGLVIYTHGNSTQGMCFYFVPAIGVVNVMIKISYRE